MTEERTATADMVGWIVFRALLASDMRAFAKQVGAYSNKVLTTSVFEGAGTADSVNVALSVALYDAIMLYAHAATAVMSEGGNLHDGDVITAAVRNTSFTGVGGTVVLTSEGDRIECHDFS